MWKVLIADDSHLARKMMKNLLVKMDCQVVAEADSGEKALIKFRSTMPDLVLMDVVMPGIGGIEAAKRILSQYPSARIIIVTAHMQNNLKSELLENGLRFLIMKPLNESNLSEAIRGILSNGGTNIVLDQEEEERLRTEVRGYLEKIAGNKREISQKRDRTPEET